MYAEDLLRLSSRNCGSSTTTILEPSLNLVESIDGAIGGSFRASSTSLARGRRGCQRFGFVFVDCPFDPPPDGRAC